MPPHYVCCVFGTVFAHSKTCHQLAQTPAFVRDPDPSVERTGAHRSGGIPRPPADQVYAANRTYGVKLRREGYAGLWTTRGAGTAWPTAESWGGLAGGGTAMRADGAGSTARASRGTSAAGRPPARTGSSAGPPGTYSGRRTGRWPGPCARSAPRTPVAVAAPPGGGGGHGLAGDDSTVAYTALV